jgi:CHASE2 domain-containing sensor protein
MAEKSIRLDKIMGIIITLVFLIISNRGVPSFERIESQLYDIGTRFAVADYPSADEIAVIDIDNKSLADIGPWPWPRHIIAEMISLLHGEGAGLIGVNILFSEKELDEGIKGIKNFREKYSAYPPADEDISLKNWVLDSLDQIEKRLDSDSILVDSVKRSGNIILPLSSKEITTQKHPESEDHPFLVNNILSSSNMSYFFKKDIEIKAPVFPFRELAQSAAGLGHDDLSSDSLMGSRSHPIYRSYKGDIVPSFPLRLGIAYFNQQPAGVIAEENRIKLKGRPIPLTGGEMLVLFEKSQQVFSKFSFSDVFNNKQLQSKMKGKVVIIGFNHSGSSVADTPISPHMAESELTAHIFANIINFSPVARPGYMLYIEALVILLTGIGVSVFLPGRAHRLTGIIVTTGSMFLILLGGVIILSFMGIWFKTVYISGCIAAIFLYLFAKAAIVSGAFASEPPEISRLLGLNFQSQGRLDLAFEKFKRLPLDNETKGLIYNLGFEFEKRRLTRKAVTAYEYINRGGGFRDLNDRIPRLKALDKSSTLGSYGLDRGGSPLVDSGGAARTVIGRYKILDKQGKGSMGVVFKALDPKINRLVALKIIQFSEEFDEEVIQEIKERFFREAEIAGQLSHPSIVTIHDLGDDGDVTYMAMEFLEGENLDSFINKENLLPLRKILNVVSRISSALDYAHKQNVIHRDIKPANVMLLKNGNIKVTDFGIAKAISASRTKTGVILGTPNYMSPEQIMGQKIDLRSDIFSLGVLFYQLLTGELPFHGENLSGLLYQITQVTHPSPRNFNPKIPKVCEQILNKAMAKDPNKRFGSAGEFSRVTNALGLKIDQIRRRRSFSR